jgi:hypothetical protein
VEAKAMIAGFCVRGRKKEKKKWVALILIMRKQNEVEHIK